MLKTPGFGGGPGLSQHLDAVGEVEAPGECDECGSRRARENTAHWDVHGHGDRPAGHSAPDTYTVGCAGV